MWCRHLCSIRDVSLDIAERRNTGGERALAVEQCSCPRGYRGLSCEVRRHLSIIRVCQSINHLTALVSIIYGCLVNYDTCQSYVSVNQLINQSSNSPHVDHTRRSCEVRHLSGHISQSTNLLTALVSIIRLSPSIISPHVR